MDEEIFTGCGYSIVGMVRSFLMFVNACVVFVIFLELKDWTGDVRL